MANERGSAPPPESLQGLIVESRPQATGGSLIDSDSDRGLRDRPNRFQRQREHHSPPEVHSSGGSFKRRYSPDPEDYGSSEDDAEREALSKLRESLPVTERDFYSYAAIQPLEIRLILLCPGQDEDDIHCSVKRVLVEKIKEKRLRYQALSYSWGEDLPADLIFLQDISVSQQSAANETAMFMSAEAKPRPFALRPNLFAALRRLRSKTDDVWLWVDAICINQKDNDEKNHQLPKMPDIYRNAWNVTIWIGECEGPNADSDRAMDFLPSILNLKILDRMVEGGGHDKETLKSWVAFAELLKRSWFSRRWVIQEIAFAKRASIRCGSRVISWLDFSDAVELFTRKLPRIRVLYDASKLSRSDPDALNNVESVGAHTMVTTTNSMLRKTEDGGVLEYSWNLESLVMRLTSFAATDPRDAIYAFCALAKDGNDNVKRPGAIKNGNEDSEPFTPQYSKSVRHVYMEFVEYCVKNTGSLDIICRHWALPPFRPLQRSKARSCHLRNFEMEKTVPEEFLVPSWVGLIADSAFGLPPFLTGRINGDSLVGQPGAKMYNASLSIASVVCFPVDAALTDMDRPTTDQHQSSPVRSLISKPLNGELHAQGIILHRIDRVSSRVVDGTIADDCLQILGWDRDNKSFEAIPDQIWRTLVADRGPEGKFAPKWYKRACAYALRKTSAEGDLNTSKLISNTSLPESVLEYLKRVQNVVWSKKSFSCGSSLNQRGRMIEKRLHDEVVCRKDTLFGIGSRNIKKGHLVCILFGCSVPVVLKRSSRSEDGKTYHVTFICETYLHGKMGGEVLIGMDAATITAKTVNFVIS